MYVSEKRVIEWKILVLLEIKKCAKKSEDTPKSSLDSTSHKNISKVRNMFNYCYTMGTEMGAPVSQSIPTKFGVHIFKAGPKDVSNICHVKEHQGDSD